MADSRKLALAHEERLRVEGLEALRKYLNEILTLVKAPDQQRPILQELKRIHKAIEASSTVRHQLEAATVVRGPSFEMIDGVTRLIGEIADARARKLTMTQLLSFARETMIRFDAQVKYAASLAGPS